jgi:hypothetical protein
MNAEAQQIQILLAFAFKQQLAPPPPTHLTNMELLLF